MGQPYKPSQLSLIPIFQEFLALWELPGLGVNVGAFCGGTTKCPTAFLLRRFPKTRIPLVLLLLVFIVQ